MKSPLQVRFGAQPWQQNVSWGEYLRCVQEVEEVGFDSCWVMDHILAVDGNVEHPCFEGYTLLAAMAARTSRLRIGALVTGNSHRAPGMLAKMATTIDHISGGRFDFGLGAGWAELEHTMYSMPFPGLGERVARMAEAMDLIKMLWTQDRATYSGKYYNVKDAVFEPKPIQKPHPPIWIGGSGEKVTLRTVAKHADNWNPGGSVTIPVLRRKKEILGGYCREIGRDVNEIEVSMQAFLFMDNREKAEAYATRWASRQGCLVAEAKTAMLIGTGDEIVEQIEVLVKEGVTYFVIPFEDPNSYKYISRFAKEVIPHFKKTR